VTCQTRVVLPAQVTVGDPTAARLVLLIVITLVVIGLALIAVAVWLVRATRVDPPEVAVLELMTTHAYLSADTEERERMIERVLAEVDDAEVTDAAVDDAAVNDGKVNDVEEEPASEPGDAPEDPPQETTGVASEHGVDVGADTDGDEPADSTRVSP
jgi:hypothetical protein